MKPRQLHRLPQLRAILHGLFGFSLLAVLAAGILLSLAAMLTSDQPPTAPILPVHDSSRLLDGRAAAEFQHELEQSIALREPAVGFWGGIRYAVFREGLAGVAVGSDDWLFSAEEFVARASAQQEAEGVKQAVQYISQVQQQLSGYDAALLIVPIPAKARVYSEQLGRYTFPSAAVQRYNLLLESLQQHEISAVDVLTRLQQLKASGEKVFLRTDTHWTPAGAAAVAASAADHIRSSSVYSSIQQREYTVHTGSPAEYHGDLLNFIPLGPFRGRLAPHPDTIPEIQLMAGPAPAVGLFDISAVPVVLIGTSYSAGEQWGFAAYLQEQLQAEVLNLAQDGRGPYQPMQEYLSGETLQQAPPQVVIWEIPERYLVLEPPPQ